MLPDIRKFLPDEKKRRSLRLILGLIYSLYNAIIGLLMGSVWHITISVYYTLLLAVKVIVYSCLKSKNTDKMSTRIFITTCILLFLISLSLIAPVILMITNERPVIFPLEIAIVIAAYTTYKVTVAVIVFVKKRRTTNILISEIVSISMIEAILSILTLQNTLITVNDGAGDPGLTVLSAVSSAVGIAAILYLVLRLILLYFRLKKACE